jgi:hypothetical protein
MSDVVLMWYPSNLKEATWHVTIDFWKQVDESQALAVVERIIQARAQLPFSARFTDASGPGEQAIRMFKDRAFFHSFNSDGSCTGVLDQHKVILVSSSAVRIWRYLLQNSELVSHRHPQTMVYGKYVAHMTIGDFENRTHLVGKRVEGGRLVLKRLGQRAPLAVWTVRKPGQQQFHCERIQ